MDRADRPRQIIIILVNEHEEVRAGRSAHEIRRQGLIRLTRKPKQSNDSGCDVVKGKLDKAVLRSRSIDVLPAPCAVDGTVSCVAARP